MDYLERYLNQIVAILSRPSWDDWEMIAAGFVGWLTIVTFLYLMLRSCRKGENFKMGSRQLSAKDKKFVVELLEDVIEERILRRKMTRKQARTMYSKLGHALQIEELIPRPELKGMIRSRLKHMNGNRKPVIIPGDPIPTAVPSVARKVNTKKDRENFNKFFVPKTA